MTQYSLELLFPEDMPKDIRESIEKIIKTPPRPEPFDIDIRLHEAKLRYIPAIELTALRGSYRSGEVKRVFEYLSSRVEVKRGRSQFEMFVGPRGEPRPSRHYHYFWPANVFELDEVKAELEFMKSDSFLRLENEDDVKLVKKLWLWHNCESNLQYRPEYKDKLDKMSEEEKNRAIWKCVIDFVRHDALAYEKILNAYKKFEKLFWFTFYNPLF
ncbi:MAG: hypothetical protein QXI87_09220 [Thermoproteota archaeon]